MFNGKDNENLIECSTKCPITVTLRQCLFMPKVDYLMQQMKLSISLLQTGIDILSGFHRALLQSLVISRSMQSIIQNLEVKIYVLKSLKNAKLKITPTCFGSYVIHH